METKTELVAKFKQPSTWAGIIAVITGVGGFISGSMDAKMALDSVIGGLILIFMPEFAKGKK